MKIVSIRTRAFTGYGIEKILAVVDRDGRVWVYDSIAGHFTTCHALTPRSIKRIQKLAA